MIGDKIDFESAKSATFSNKQRTWTPTGKGDSGYERVSSDFPEIFIKPKFTIPNNAKFFTIGSCFAREVEAALLQQNVVCLTEQAKFPASYYGLAKLEPTNGALNVYTPAAILDLISLAERSSAESVGALQVGDEWCDMLLSGLRLLTREEFDDARRILLEAYKRLPEADVVVITLGYTEAWFDTIDKIYVNRSPGASTATMRLGSRYQFQNLSAVQAIDYLEQAVVKIRTQTNERAKVIITTSPVPLHATFTGNDVISANTYSKCTLVSAAVYLASKYDFIDYFPSYEFVTQMQRSQAFVEDGVHVRRQVVEKIMEVFSLAYIQ